jgi:DNA-directed RNA polymerase specialized sigma24 family protein
VAYHPFPQTRCTVVLSAKTGEVDDSAAAMQELALAYWQPIYAYLRGSGGTHEEAQDATQGFFAYLLGREFPRNIEPEGGRFRNFLLVALRRWMRDERYRAINVKREAEIEFQPWHEAGLDDRAPPPSATSPEEAFDRSWAEALVARSMQEIKRQENY